ncbi:hypothetical protein VPNG_10327 [Cytospora leucostoma]|uniref:Uncharacterized protein n=1 Tax=Cytospora leucostoma TaxID=1230097 RepID=A0A423VBG4_9PEZI|nr:hypothetical protein VPNG_10327 [Cytospora leucostoma]
MQWQAVGNKLRSSLLYRYKQLRRDSGIIEVWDDERGHVVAHWPPPLLRRIMSPDWAGRPGEVITDEQPTATPEPEPEPAVDQISLNDDYDYHFDDENYETDADEEYEDQDQDEDQTQNQDQDQEEQQEQVEEQEREEEQGERVGQMPRPGLLQSEPRIEPRHAQPQLPRPDSP